MSLPAQSSGGATPPSSDAGRWRLIAAALAVLLLVTGGAVVYAVVSDDDSTPTTQPTPTRTRTRPALPTTVPTQQASVGEEPAPPAGAAEPGAALRDVRYCNNDGVDLLLDFYHAPTEGPTPLLIFIHGGGWTSGDKNQVARMEAFEPLLEAGYSLASPNYRLAPEVTFPAPILDVTCAVRHLRANAQAYGIDPDRIAISGFSAGSHLSLLAGLSDETAGFDEGMYAGVPSDVSAIVNYSGQVDVNELVSSHPEIARNIFTGDAAAMTAASPISYLDAQDPPTLIIHGDADVVVNVAQAELLDARLTELGVEHETLIVPGGIHQLPADPAYTADLIAFLDQHLA